MFPYVTTFRSISSWLDSETQSHSFALHVTPEPVCFHQVFDQYGWIGLGEAEWIYCIRGVYRVVFNDCTEEQYK
ncbi:hypothetical protein PsorP6_013992 [Peronosclerospora sorghi]|uniref:Uncharacterized protein n=1 Tax=Peronosclerospora sorghi TaxID=230839 RepID=A0ACC0VG05_9STRA|nr:hypothetical protein PsorP6_013992 [Peronosclerospora sorghi]